MIYFPSPWFVSSRNKNKLRRWFTLLDNQSFFCSVFYKSYLTGLTRIGNDLFSLTLIYADCLWFIFFDADCLWFLLSEPIITSGHDPLYKLFFRIFLYVFFVVDKPTKQKNPLFLYHLTNLHIFFVLNFYKIHTAAETRNIQFSSFLY